MVTIVWSLTAQNVCSNECVVVAADIQECA